MTALSLPIRTDHERNVLRAGRYLAHAIADAAWLWRVACNLEEALDNPDSPILLRALADYDLAAVRVRLFTERLLKRLSEREGEPFERYTGGVGAERVTVEFWRALHFVTAKLDN